jgi:hypothetical protein
MKNKKKIDKLKFRIINLEMSLNEMQCEWNNVRRKSLGLDVMDLSDIKTIGKIDETEAKNFLYDMWLLSGSYSTSAIDKIIAVSSYAIEYMNQKAIVPLELKNTLIELDVDKVSLELDKKRFKNG